MITPDAYKTAVRKTSADLAREQGWTVGTRLVGSDGVDLQRVTITAIGTALVLADDGRCERPLDLSYRQWASVDPVRTDVPIPPLELSPMFSMQTASVAG